MQARTRTRGVVRRLAPGLALASSLAVMAAACSSGGGAGAAAAGGPVATPLASAASSAPAGAGGASGGTAASALDPCQVVTAADASQLAGRTLKQTGDTSLTRSDRVCTYSASGISVVVTVAQLPSSAPAQAQAYYQQSVAKLSNLPGVTLRHPGIGDKSLAGTLNMGGFRESAIAFLKGTVYVSIQTTPNVSLAPLKALAVTALGRV